MSTDFEKSSGTRRIASVQLDLACSVASMRSGRLLGESTQGHARAQLEGLAATLPDLFGTLDTSCLDRIAERFGEQGGGRGFSEIFVLSEQHVHVVQPLTRRPGEAFLAVSPATSSVGLVLSAVHEQVAALEGE